jgi:opacity protein-like surface antigen
VKKALVKAGCAVGLLSVMACAIADASLPAGWYVEGNIGQSKATSKVYPGVSLLKNTGRSWDVNIGYKFMPYVGLEAGFIRYAPTRLNSPVQTVARDSHTAYDIAAKGMLPFGCSGLELFAKAGAVRINSQIGVIDSNGAAAYGLTFNTSGQTSTGLYVGGGLSYSFAPNVAFNVQWDRGKGNSKTGNFQLITAGISYLLDPVFI